MFISKYGVARHIYYPVTKRGVNDYAISSDWTPAAGDVKISKNGGTAANVTNLPTAITMGNTAMWDFSLTATEMQAAQVVVMISDSATKVIEDDYFVIETHGNASGQFQVDLADGVRAGLTALPNAAAEAAGGLFTRGTGAGQIAQDANGRVSVNLVAILGTALTETAGQIAAGFKKFFDIASPTSTMNVITTVTTATTATNLTNAPTAGDLTATMKTSVTTAATAATPTASLSSGATQAIWDKLTSALTTTGSIGKLLVDNVNASISAIKTQTDKLAFTVANQIDANVLDWKSATAPAMTGDAYARLGAPAGASVSADIAAVKTDTGNIYGKVDTEVASIISTLGVAGAGLTALGDTRIAHLDADISSISAPSAADVADAVWDETIADHSTSGSTGSALAAAGGSGDPWSTSLPGSYSTGQAGKIIGDYLDAAVSSRLADTDYTEPANSDITAIKAKTDNLPAAPASSGDVTTAVSDLETHGDTNWATATGFATSADVPSAADVSDAVWDETIADHADVGSTGAALAAAGGSGDPWSTALPGSYGAGTAGKIIGDYLDAAISGVPTADEVADEVATRTLDANVTKVNSVTVNGAGTDADPWGPA